MTTFYINYSNEIGCIEHIEIKANDKAEAFKKAEEQGIWDIIEIYS